MLLRSDMIKTAEATNTTLRGKILEEVDGLNECLGEDRREAARMNLVAWIIPKDALSSCFSTPGIT